MTSSGAVSRSRTALAEVGLFYAAVVWGATFFMVKGALDGIDPVTMVAYRFLIAGLALLIPVLIAKKDVTANAGRALFLAVVLALLYIPQTVGLGITSASNSGFITGMFVAFTPLLLLTLFRRKPTLMETLGCAISLVGLWILTGGLHEVNAGDLLTLVAAFTYALHVLYSDRYMKAGADPLVISCQQFLLVGLISLGYSLVDGRPLAITQSSSLWVVLFLALIPTLSAFVIQMYAQQIIAPVKVTLIFAFEPVFAGVFAWTLGSESFEWHSAGGGLCIFLALLVSGLPDSYLMRLFGRAQAESSDRNP